jgi:hypothetical protein
LADLYCLDKLTLSENEFKKSCQIIIQRNPQVVAYNDPISVDWPFPFDSNLSVLRRYRELQYIVEPTRYTLSRLPAEVYAHIHRMLWVLTEVLFAKSAFVDTLRA